VTLTERIATVRKAIVALLGVLTTLATANLLPENVSGWVSSAAGVVTIVLTYWVPNADEPGKHAAAL
jgi:hypothetical protein